MARWNLQLKEKELVTAVTVLFLLGVLLGFLCLKLIGVIAGGEKIQVDEAYLKQIAGVVPGFDLYLYTEWIKLKNMFLYFLLVGMLGMPVFSSVSGQGSVLAAQKIAKGAKKWN
ncbi:hypothetical protein, partial [Romboutsia ilealis]|uniref:hypothetical protein n=1 Tax=Romboutsia ilealis TaxID=1115758 RepID=UPI002729A673